MSNEPVLGIEYGTGFICPVCGAQGPRLVAVGSSEKYRLRVECVRCGYYTEYMVNDN